MNLTQIYCDVDDFCLKFEPNWEKHSWNNICLIEDNETKCDAIFLYQTDIKKYSFLVELKGSGDIKKAFKQLSYTVNSRVQYRDLIDLFDDNSAVKEKLIIVSDRPIQSFEMQKLENQYGIRVGKITHSTPNTPIPDLKDKI